MKKFYILFTTLLCLNLSAQKGLIAITGSPNGGINFKDIRTLEDNRVILDTNYNHRYQGIPGEAPIQPLIAAAEVNAAGDKVLYLPMASSVYYVLDIKSGTVTAHKSDDIVVAGCDEGFLYSRMGRVADGSIYALNNNSTQLLKFTEKNGTFVCESVGYLNFVGTTMGKTLDDRDFAWGGDLIGDAFGNLFLISAHNNIFKIDPKRKEITFYSKIEGLPDGFTSNGVAAMEDGSVLLASNGSTTHLYALDFASSTAKLYKDSNTERIYDLASPYLMSKKESEIANQIADLKSSVRVYPSMVENQLIHVDNDSKSDLTVQVFDLNGTQIASSLSRSKSKNQSINLNQAKPGVYLVRLLDGSGAEVINTKVTVVK